LRVRPLCSFALTFIVGFVLGPSTINNQPSTLNQFLAIDLPLIRDYLLMSRIKSAAVVGGSLFFTEKIARFSPIYSDGGGRNGIQLCGLARIGEDWRGLVRMDFCRHRTQRAQKEKALEPSLRFTQIYSDLVRSEAV
jgi:hypothetical protein